MEKTLIKLREKAHKFDIKLDQALKEVELRTTQIAEKITKQIVKNVRKNPEIKRFKLLLNPMKVLGLTKKQINYLLRCDYEAPARRQFLYCLVDIQAKICIGHDYVYEVTLDLNDKLVVRGLNGITEL